MPPHPGQIIGGQGDFRAATRPKTPQIGTAFETESAIRLNFLAKVLYSFMPHYRSPFSGSSSELQQRVHSLSRRSGTAGNLQYHNPRKNGN
jgi:hypothetical protein